MTVRIGVETDSSGITAQMALLNTIPEMLEDEIQLVADDMITPALAQIARTAPPRGSNEFVWSDNPSANQRAKNWWFANIKKGRIPTDGRHYARQGRPPYGFRVRVLKDGDKIVIAIGSQWDKSGMVFGSTRFGRGQLPGHKSTGWPLVAAGIVTVLGQANVELLDRMNKRLKASQKRGFFGRFRR